MCSRCFEGADTWRGYFLLMNEELLKKLADIFPTEDELNALKSLIDERKNHLMYRELDREFYFGDKTKHGGIES